MKIGNRISLVSILCVVSAMAAACTSGSGSGGATGGTGGGATGGTLTYGYAGGGLTSLNPNTITSGSEEPVAPLLFDSLTKEAQDGSTQPSLATSWTHSTDYKTWTFKLHSGVRYHSGKVFTAQDAVKNIEYVLDKSHASQERNFVSGVTKASAPDTTTLVLQLNTPNSLMPAALANLYMANVDTIGQVDQNGDGTGPFKLAQFVSDDHIVLTRNDSYWGAKAKLATIRIQRAADLTSAETALRTGSLDVLWGIAPGDVSQIKSASNLQLVEPASSAGDTVWELDTTSPPFNNVKARQALAYAADRATMQSTAFGGVGDVASTNDILDKTSPAYASSQQAYDFDLQKAKQLFTEAGVAQGTTLTFWTIAGRHPEWVSMGEILQQDLQKIGIKLQIKQEEVSTWLQKFFPAGKKFPGVIVANFWNLKSNPAYALNWYAGGCECNWNDPTYNSLLQQALQAPDDTSRNGVYAQMQQLLNQQVPSIVILQNASIVAASSKVKGIWSSGDGTPHLEQASIG
jgi:peptide/nickel transport system substrate-binding protein